MAFLFLKSLLFPRKSETHSSKTRYSPLPPHPPNDIERGHFEPSEKTSQLSHTSNPSSNSRINPRLIADVTIGLSDGLTVPFALTAGLSALGDPSIVIYGGLAELIAGGISMGLGGYLGAKSEAEAYRAALAETRSVVREDRGRAAEMVREAFEGFEFGVGVLDGVVEALEEDGEAMVEFLMKFYRLLEGDDFVAEKAYFSGLTISAGYIFGGLVPLLPYLCFASVQDAFAGSVVVMVGALFVFGWAKTALVGEKDRWVCGKNGVQMVLMGSVAAGAAMLSVKGLSG